MRGSILQARQMRFTARACVPALGGAFVAVMLCAFPAHAQWIGAPGGDGSSGGSSGAVTITAPQPGPAAGAGGGFAPGMGTPQQAAPQGMSQGAAQANPNMSECQGQVMKLRGDLEARGGALEKAAKAKRPPTELCPLFRNFTSAQQSFYSYLSTNKTKCGVPDDVIAQLKKNVNSVNATRNKVCEVAKLQESGGGAGPSGPPPQGQISAGLGLPSGLPSVGAPKGGMFDTLGGDALR